MECNVNIACFQETNLQWSTPITKQIAQIICDQPTKQSKLAVSNSLKITPSNYQPGGTCTAAIGSWSSTAKSASQGTHLAWATGHTSNLEGKKAAKSSL